MVVWRNDYICQTVFTNIEFAMDYKTFSKPKMWANVAGGIICYIMFVYELGARSER